MTRTKFSTIAIHTHFYYNGLEFVKINESQAISRKTGVIPFQPDEIIEVL